VSPCRRQSSRARTYACSTSGADHPLVAINGTPKRSCGVSSCRARSSSCTATSTSSKVMHVPPLTRHPVLGHPFSQTVVRVIARSAVTCRGQHVPSRVLSHYWVAVGGSGAESSQYVIGISGGVCLPPFLPRSP